MSLKYLLWNLWALWLPRLSKWEKNVMCTTNIQPINTRRHLYMPVHHSDSGSLCLCFFVTHAVLQKACCFPPRSGHVSYHSDYFGALLRDWDIRDRRAELAPWVHTNLCAVLCQVLHHWSYRIGGGCPWGSPPRCHHFSSLLSEGNVNQNTLCVSVHVIREHNLLQSALMQRYSLILFF